VRRLPKNAVNYFVLSLRVIFTIIWAVIIIYNIVNNDDDYRIQDPVLLFTIPMGTRKNLSEIYLQIGHAFSERFASLDVYPRCKCEIQTRKAFRLTLTAFFQAVFPNGLTTPYLVYFLKT
jgi:hypothetical protein